VEKHKSIDAIAKDLKADKKLVQEVIKKCIKRNIKDWGRLT